MPRILVADDNANIQKMVTLAFQERGIDVVAVGNGEAAVRKIPAVNPDLVLADVFMPVRNGYEVCEFVKKDPRYAHVPVILLVGAFDPLDEKEARRVGADGVLKKPFIPPDPLIAMVMSALEKNPKIAAELAKAKEAKEVIVAPAQPELEIAAKKEPVPLPEFPEPTAEEAAAIYGFGKGVRAGDDEEGNAGSKALKSAAAKGKGQQDDDDNEDEEFGGASASRKWRRAAMDLEIPDDVGNQPAFSGEQDFGPITFPSERDVPPKHVGSEDRVEKINVEPAASRESAATLESPSIDAAESESSEVIAKEAEPVFFGHSSSEPAAATPGYAASESEVSEPMTEAAPFAFANEQAPAEAQASGESSGEPGVDPPPAPQSEIQSESAESHSAPAAHWMDMMAPGPSSEYRSGSWLDAARPSEETPAPSVPVAAAPEGQERADERPLESERDHSLVAAEARHEQIIENFADTKPHVMEAEGEAVTAGSADFEARSSFNERHPVGFSYHIQAPEEHRQGDSESIVEPERGAEPETVASAESDFFASEETPANGSDSRAIESHDEHRIESGAEVIPEASPFFADQAHEESRSHIAPGDEFRPLHSFLPPAPEEVVPEADAKSDFFASFAEETRERIPTLAPENRAELAGIPFLNPDAPEKAGSNGADNGKMEAAAQRVLEKLQPQLQDLLSQGLLKPLIESLLQQELEKREK